METKFVHLKLHTEYSLLEGVGKIDEYVARAKSLNMSSLAITDTSMFGVVEFYKKCLKNGIKPIIGLEIFLDGIVTEGEYSLTLIAKNEKGYKSLCKISSLSYSRFNRRRNKIKYEELLQNSEGLYILSGGIHSEAVEGLKNYKYPEVKKMLIKLSKDFKENFYIEIPSSIGLYNVKKSFFEILRETDLQFVIVNDIYYPNNGDAILQKIMASIKDGNKIDSNEVEILYDDLYLKSQTQIMESFTEFDPEIISKGIENTHIIAQNCNVKFNFDEFKFPEYKLPDGVTEEKYIRDLVYEGLKTKYSKELPKNVIDRAEYELQVINSMGYNGYFIIVWDFIRYAKENGIYVGPGRGSAAGSIVSYALNITEIDPQKYNLIFERFLNPERISMPDIDIDFDQEQREQVIEYVLEKYGVERVAHIITFGTLKARAAIRDVGRVLNVNIKKVDMVAKLIPFMMELEAALSSVDRLQELYKTDHEIKQLIDYSLKLEGRVRHASVHAAGIVISKEVLNEEIPTYSDGKTKILSTQYQMKELEDLGILKMDFLGLKNLTILRKTIENIKKTRNEDIILSNINLDDKNAYDLLTTADTLGIFQCESAGIRNLMKRVKIEKFEDIVAVLALYRPGPLRSGMVEDFIQSKNNKVAIKYMHESLQDVLEETYGVILYQEQVMKIVNIMANYTLGEADELRRAIGKKIPEIIEENRNKFVRKSVENGIDERVAQEVYRLIDKFGGYGFNKSHSAAYALIVYWTAYFKSNYSKEFFAAVMSTEMYNIERLSLFINEAKEKGIIVHVPDVNKSNYEFTVEEDGIRFGLVAIKGIGINTVNGIIKIRNDETDGKYKSYDDFVHRVKQEGLNKKQLEALIFSGALDLLDGNRREKHHSIDKIMDWSEKKFNSEEDLQLILFGGKVHKAEDFYLEKMDEFKKIVLLNKEKEHLGVYISDHPLNAYKSLIDMIDHTSLNELEQIEKRNQVNKIRLIGIISDINKITTKASMEPMAKFKLEDFTGLIECVCFPRDFVKYGYQIYDDNVVIVEGHINNEKNKKTIITSNISNILDLEENKYLNLYILIDEETKDFTSDLKSLIRDNKGENAVYMAIVNDEKREIIKLSDKYKVNLSKSFIGKLVKLVGTKKIRIK